MDSTMLLVCKNCRIKNYRVARDITDWDKNHQGWHYDFKLHAAIDHAGNLSAIHFTPANAYDVQQIPYLTNDDTKIAVGDGTYNANKMAL
jgi:hypothetical protein